MTTIISGYTYSVGAEQTLTFADGSSEVSREDYYEIILSDDTELYFAQLSTKLGDEFKVDPVYCRNPKDCPSGVDLTALMAELFSK